MDLAFSSWQEIPFTENHIKQLHQILLRYSEKDTWHRGSYKTHSCSVTAFDKTGVQIGIVFQTASPFDTPRLMTEPVAWVKQEREKIVLATMPELQLQIVGFACEHGRVTIGEVIKLTGASRNTLKQHFRAPVERGTLDQHGSGRGVWYDLH